MIEDATDVALFVTSGVIMLMVVFGVARKAWSSGVYSYMRSILATVADAINPWNQPDIDEADSLVQVRAQQLRIEHTQWALQLTSIVSALPATMIMVNLSVGNERLYSTTQTVVFLAMAATSAFILILPDVAFKRSTDALYSVLVLGACVFASPWASKPSDMAILSILGIDLPLVMLNLARRKLSLNVLLNLLFSISSCSTVLVSGPTLALLRPGATCAFQILWLTMFPVCAYCVDLSIARMIRQGVEFQAAKEALSAASAMLRSSYDVVVELSADGTILTPTIALESFLLRPGRCLQNTMLVDLISHEADKRLFLGKLFAPRHDDMSLAEATHVRMRDGNDNVVRVELLWFRFWFLDGQPHYMLGLREFSDVVSVKRGQHQENDHYVDNDMSGTPTYCSEVTSLGSNDQVDEPLAIVGVDTQCAGLHLREVSVGFNIRVGRLPLGACLAELIQRRNDFTKWLQDATNAAIDEEDVPACHVTLLMRTGRVTAQCRLLRRPHECEESEHESTFDPEHARLLFFDIKQCGQRRVGHRTAAHEQVQRQGTPVKLLSL